MSVKLGSNSSSQANQQQFNSCLLCNDERLKTIRRYQHAHLVKCGQCGFVFGNRIPSSEELVAHYNTYPRNEAISPITLKRYDELLAYFEPYRNTNCILDVGCGNGHFLSEAKKKGWQVYGTEYTDTAINICNSKGITMLKGKLNPADFGQQKFDVITSFEVLEHINNPVEEIINFNTLLRDKGIVYLTTPNFNSLSRLVLKEKWNIIEYPEHLCYYTAKTLHQLFRKAGFKNVLLKTTGISINRFQQSTHTVEDGGAATNNDEALRQKSESNALFSFLKKVINGLLSLTRKGDTLKAVFEKE